MDSLQKFLAGNAELADCLLLGISVDGLLRAVDVRIELAYDEAGNFLPDDVPGPILSIHFSECIEVTIASGLPLPLLVSPSLTPDIAQLAAIRIEAVGTHYDLGDVHEQLPIFRTTIGFDQAGVGGRRKVVILSAGATYFVADPSPRDQRVVPPQATE